MGKATDLVLRLESLIAKKRELAEEAKEQKEVVKEEKYTQLVSNDDYDKVSSIVGKDTVSQDDYNFLSSISENWQTDSENGVNPELHQQLSDFVEALKKNLK